MSLTIFPTFFPDFRCKAGACRHTCCQTWEIDIDEDTKNYYQTLKSPLCQELRQWMGTSEDGSTCFRLNEKGYCHFLNKAGLCRLVLELGEDALCDICREHPRFYKYPCGAELSGTGLCCERTVEEIAGHLPLTFELLDPEAAEPKPMTVTFSQLMDELLLPLSEEECHFTLDLSPKAVSAMLDAMADTEPIDAAWTKDLSWMQACAEDLVDKARAHPPKVPAGFWDAIYQYIIYRQLDLARPEDGDQPAVPVSVLARFAAESTLFIYLEAVRTGDPFRAVSRWSEQIEYDTDNWRDQIEELTSHFLISNH